MPPVWSDLLASTFGIVCKLDRRYDSKHQNWQKKNLVLGGPRFAIAHRGVASHRSMALTMVVAWSARLLEIDFNCGEKNAMKNSDADHSWPLPDWSLKHDWLKDVHSFPRLHTTAWSACGVPGASFRGGLREWGKWQWSYQRQWCKELPKQPRPLVSAAVSTFCRIQAGTAWEAPGRTPSQAPRDFTLPFSCWKMSWKSNLSIYWLRRLPCLPNDWTACIMHCIASQSVSASCQFRGCIASMTHPCSFHSFIFPSGGSELRKIRKEPLFWHGSFSWCSWCLAGARPSHAQS